MLMHTIIGYSLLTTAAAANSSSFSIAVKESASGVENKCTCKPKWISKERLNFLQGNLPAKLSTAMAKNTLSRMSVKKTSF